MALLELEFSILYFIQGLHTPFLDRFMTAVTSLGDKGWFFIVLGIILFCFKRTRKMGAAVLLSLAAGGLIGNVVLKNLVMRDRPCWIDESVRLLIQNPKDFSFPSGHTLASFETAVSIFLYNRKCNFLLYKKWMPPVNYRKASMPRLFYCLILDTTLISANDVSCHLSP